MNLKLYKIRKFILRILIIGSVLLSGCSLILTMGGRYDELEQYWERIVTDPEKAPIDLLNALCSTYNFTKNYNKLFTCLDHMENKIRQGETTSFGVDFSPLPDRLRAWAWIDLGNYPAAITSAKKAYRIVQNSTTKSIEIRAFLNIDTLGARAIAHVLNGEPEEGERLITSIREIEPGMQAEYQSILIVRIYMLLEKYNQALETLTDRAYGEKELIGPVPAWLMFQEEIANDDPLKGTLMNPVIMKIPQIFMVSKILLETGDIENAKKGYDKLVGIPQIKQVGFLSWYIFFDRGRIAEMRGNDREAVRYYNEAIDIIEQKRSTISQDTAKIGFVADKEIVYKHMIQSLRKLNRQAEAFEYVERAKARALIDLLRSRKEFAVPEGDREEANELIAELIAAEQSIERPAQEQQQKQRRNNIQKLKKQLETVSPQLTSLVTVSYLKTDAIQALLPKDETLIEYYWQGKDLHAFVVDQQQVISVTLNSKQLKEEIEIFREELRDPETTEYQFVSKQLYARLFEPLKEKIKTDKLLIVPHGFLHYLPFNALHSGKEYLIDRYNLRSLPSASVMRFLKTGKSEEKKLLGFGNPDLGDPEQDLDFAQKEVETIAKLWPESSTILLRKQATETFFKRNGKKFNHLHFASHGIFSANDPLNASGLFLVGDFENDGFLSVNELYTINLKAELVTLSACQTALGHVSNGDDVIGFSRGFLYAGAGSIVSSLWSVDDQATGELMELFYQNLGKSTKASALRSAQLVIKEEYEHPYYWAAFQLTGNGK